MMVERNMPLGTEEIEVSIVSPVYAAADLIPELCSQLHQHLGEIIDNYEIILVFDCSPDEGWERIQEECRKDSRVFGIKLSRNFGQHEAITAGLAHTRGEWVVVMDCDLQDQPKEIPAFYAKAKEGFDVVVGRREDREDGFLKRLSSSLFHKVFNFISGIKTCATVANYGIYHRNVIQAVLSMKEPFRSFPLLVLWLGFKRCEIAVDHMARLSGKSSYSFMKLLRLALNITLSYSNRPLYLTIILGFIICSITFIFSGIYFLMALKGVFDVSGFATLILSIWFLSGMIITLLGVSSIYLAKIFDISKNRPLYVIDKTTKPKP